MSVTARFQRRPKTLLCLPVELPASHDGTHLVDFVVGAWCFEGKPILVYASQHLLTRRILVPIVGFFSARSRISNLIMGSQSHSRVVQIAVHSDRSGWPHRFHGRRCSCLPTSSCPSLRVIFLCSFFLDSVSTERLVVQS